MFLFTVCNVSVLRAETLHTDTDKGPCCRRQRAWQCGAELLKSLSPNYKELRKLEAIRASGSILVKDLVQHQAGSDRQVERVAMAHHRDAHEPIAQRLLLGREPLPFAAHK